MPDQCLIDAIILIQQAILIKVVPDRNWYRQGIASLISVCTERSAGTVNACQL